MSIRSVRRFGLYAVAVVLGIILMLPFYWAVISSLKQMNEVRHIPLVWWPLVPQWQNYLDVWTVRFFSNWVFNSILLTTIATAGTVISSSLAGYAFARFRFPGRNVLGLLLQNPVGCAYHRSLHHHDVSDEFRGRPGSRPAARHFGDARLAATRASGPRQKDTPARRRAAWAARWPRRRGRP